MMKTEKLNLTQEWDKTFPKSDKVNHRKVTFVNRYGVTLAADQYAPKNASGKLPAIAVCGPFGAVKEQCSGLYAQTMAERSFLTLAFDPSFTGESGGQPRYMASPDINTEDFQAAVDFLSVQENVDPERVGIIGICGWGGMALNAAALDTRIKATAVMTMYNTFLEAYDFSGKTIVLFATSGGSGFGKALVYLQKSAPGATIQEGKLLNGHQTADSLKAWADSVGA